MYSYKIHCLSLSVHDHAALQVNICGTGHDITENVRSEQCLQVGKHILQQLRPYALEKVGRCFARHIRVLWIL
jgi:hypothetical protein